MLMIILSILNTLIFIDSETENNKQRKISLLISEGKYLSLFHTNACSLKQKWTAVSSKKHYVLMLLQLLKQESGKIFL